MVFYVKILSNTTIIEYETRIIIENIINSATLKAHPIYFPTNYETLPEPPRFAIITIRPVTKVIFISTKDTIKQEYISNY